ncbi:MAG: hypothetical protein ACJARR_002671 [Pseudophaeobacter arcticus]|jgi:hypothetical protein
MQELSTQVFRGTVQWPLRRSTPGLSKIGFVQPLREIKANGPTAGHVASKAPATVTDALTPLGGAWSEGLRTPKKPPRNSRC